MLRGADPTIDGAESYEAKKQFEAAKLLRRRESEKRGLLARTLSRRAGGLADLASAMAERRREPGFSEAAVLAKYAGVLADKLERERASNRERLKIAAEAEAEKTPFVRVRDTLPLDVDEARGEVAAATALASAASKMDAGEGGGAAGCGVALLDGPEGRARAFRAFAHARATSRKFRDDAAGVGMGAYLLDEAEAEQFGMDGHATLRDEKARAAAALVPEADVRLSLEARGARGERLNPAQRAALREQLARERATTAAARGEAAKRASETARAAAEALAAAKATTDAALAEAGLALAEGAESGDAAAAAAQCADAGEAARMAEEAQRKSDLRAATKRRLEGRYLPGTGRVAARVAAGGLADKMRLRRKQKAQDPEAYARAAAQREAEREADLRRAAAKRERGDDDDDADADGDDASESDSDVSLGALANSFKTDARKVGERKEENVLPLSLSPSPRNTFLLSLSVSRAR